MIGHIIEREKQRHQEEKNTGKDDDKESDQTKNKNKSRDRESVTESTDGKKKHTNFLAIHPVPTASFNSSSDLYPLHNSFILDSGADGHICNNRSRFIEFESSEIEEEVRIGDTVAMIEGYGKAYAYLENMKGEQIQVTLHNTAYVLVFYINCVSY